MTTAAEENELSRVLFHYDFTPAHIEQRNSIIKIETFRGIFALKGTPMSASKQQSFLAARNALTSRSLSALPILPNKYGDHFINSESQCYYLMPWINETTTDLHVKYERLIDAAAALHSGTVQTVRKNKEETETFYQQIMDRWQRRKEFYERFADFAEHRIYPSPFEQYYLTTFVQLMREHEQMKNVLDQWSQANAESEEDRIVLCHRQLLPEHLLIENEQNYLISLEHVQPDRPASDLVFLLKRANKDLRFDEEQCHQMIQRYLSQFPLSSQERLLLRGMIHQTNEFHQILVDYIERTDRTGDITFVERWSKTLSVFEGIYHLDKVLDQTEEPGQSKSTP
ncbi:hypothetical protein [Scopulibacillus cellulosilyticus]|uniref:Spore coat protein YsxE n=1 Tax=Scopulibacillus cellulosilyticus TaxID=2665665 RepID=A0ABW2PUX7_9BACL